MLPIDWFICVTCAIIVPYKVHHLLNLEHFNGEEVLQFGVVEDGEVEEVSVGAVFDVHVGALLQQEAHHAPALVRGCHQQRTAAVLVQAVDIAVLQNGRI